MYSCMHILCYASRILAWSLRMCSVNLWQMCKWHFENCPIFLAFWMLFLLCIHSQSICNNLLTNDYACNILSTSNKHLQTNRDFMHDFPWSNGFYLHLWITNGDGNSIIWFDSTQFASTPLSKNTQIIFLWE